MVTQVRTVDFLPEIFRTETNAQFLGATLDVLTSQPELQRIGGYIGNKYGYGINPSDKYIVEPTKTRSDYQLQPSVVFLKSETQIANDFINYPGIVDALDNAGANTTNHERLFESEFYSWDPFIDLDKSVNYAQYYWIPLGPDAIPLTGSIDVTSIESAATYSSPNGVVFTNGLKVLLPSTTIPSGYANKQYYVEGVGTRIVLRPVSNYTVPEAPGAAIYNPWDTANWDTDSWDATLYVSVRPEYITISRNSDDMNAWTRANRWFHQDVLDTTTQYLGTVTNAVGNTITRAARPIIEFRGNLQLFNSGSSAIGSATLFDTVTTNAATQVVGQATYTVDGVALLGGDRVIFAADNDDVVRATIYTVSFVGGVIALTPLVVATESGQQTWILRGNTYAGTTWRYTDTTATWIQCQQKTELNQQPLYDIVTDSGVSYGNALYYSGTSFSGCPLFTYTPNPSGVDDPVLGFPLAYSGVNNIGDISFTVNFNTQTFSYIDNSGARVTESVNNGYVQQNGSNSALLTGWIPAAAPSVQYQVFQFTVAANDTTEFTLDIPLRSPTVWPNAIVYVNDEILDRSSFTSAVSGGSSTVTLDTAVNIDSRVTILALSDTPSASAYYEIPVNLQNNPFNGNVTNVDVGDLRNQYRSIYSNAPNLVGPLWGDNNYHDLPQLNKYGTAIIQNSSSLILPGVFLRKSEADFFAALGYNAQQYQLYKDLLIDLAGTNDYSIEQTPAQVLDSIIYEITTIRKNSTAFFWTDTLPSGSPYLVNNYNVGVNTSNVYYNLSRVYDYNNANYYGVALYVTRVVGGITRQIQLLRNVDYTVSSTAPTVHVYTQLLAGDVVTVREYNQTYGTYCPSTPSSLGLYPTTVPYIMTVGTEHYIVGHDASINRLYGEYNDGYLQDFRDIALYEFEKRVYNNIKVNGVLPLIYDEVNPGQWRSTDYSYDEIQNIYRTEFLNWIGSNRIDYKTQNYNVTDKFSYNYNQSSNKLNSDCSHLLQGYWRGIYRYMYDTENPALTPWEMLGFANQPDWWESRYGAAPYTSANTTLWNDLRDGLVWNNGDSYVNPLYVRSQLYTVLPVDSVGALRNPFDAVVGNYNRLTFQRNWVAGDGSPAEATYWKSSAWPFAVMRLLALTKPAKFFNLFADRDRYTYNAEYEQFLYNGRQHLNPRTLTIYGNGTAVNSYINWIVDYINVRGVNGHNTVSSLVSNTDVRLTYNLAGFSSKEHLQFYIERATPNSKNTSLLVPDENYAVLLYNNVPEEIVRYSSIIVQRTELGWTVWGNSQNASYFTVSIPQSNGNTSTVSVAGTTVRVNNDYSTETTTVPYGTLFYSVQAVSEFIRSYGQHLIDQGVVFDNIYDNVVYDWIRMVEEFLAWSQQSWSAGSTIALNPNAKIFVVNRPGLVVQPLTVYRDNFVLNQNLLPVQQQNSTVYRNNTAFTVKILNDGDTVGYTNLNLASMEHAVVFDNTTSFNDLLYNPVTGLRQNRLLLKGYKTAGWQGYVNANGFILSEDNIVDWQPSSKYAKGSIVSYKGKYWVAPQLIEPTSVFPQDKWQSIDADRIKLGMLPNPSAASVESSLYYNSNIANLELDADLLSFSLIGYRPRDYLAAADLSDITQINIYKNIVREKGTYALADSFRFAQFDQGQIEYDIHENWALNTANFGAVLGSNYVEAQLDQHALTGNPTIIGFSSTVPVSEAQQTVYLNELVNWQRPPLSAHFLPLYTESYTVERGLPSAGYVNGDDVTYKVYQYSDANTTTLLNKTLVNNTLWVARWNNSWNVFSALSVGTQIASVQNNQNGTMTVTFTGFHGLSANDPFSIVSFDSEIDGFYTVKTVNNVFAVTVVHTMNPGTLLVTGNGVALKLQSRRFAQPSDVANEYLPFNGLNSRRVWVDNDSNGEWSVWRCAPSFTPVQFPNTLSAGSSVAYSNAVGYLLGNSNTWTVYQTSGIGATPIPFGVTPGFGKQIVIAGNAVIISSNDYVYYYRVINGGLVQTQQINASGVTAIAASANGSWLYIAIPGSIGVYRLDNNTYSVLNTITQPLDAIEWGFALSTSTDGSRLFVGAPGTSVSGLTNAGALYVYSRITERFLITVSSPVVNLSSAPTGGVVDVYINGVLTTAYTLVGSTITLNTSPTVGTVITVSTAGITQSETHRSPQPRLGGRYGHSVATNRWGADVVVGAPYEVTNLGGATTVEGSVYRYTNSGQRYGIVTLENPNVIAGDQIWINGYRVLWDSPTTDTSVIANAINTQTPVNVTASVSGTTVLITLYDNTAETLYNLIDIVGSAAVLDRLNINLYARTQTLHAYNRPQSAQYGWSLAMNERDGLLVGAPSAPRIAATTFDYTDDDDNNDTVFDNGATTFVDNFSNNGLAYLYEYMPAYNENISNPGAYAFAQYLTSTVPTTSTQQRWGSALAWRDGVIIIGSADYYGSNSGQVITYSSSTGSAWYRESVPLPRVDISRVNNLCIYNRLDNTTLGHLGYCDPLQGVLLGPIASNLDYIGASDPAGYANTALQWGVQQVGSTWFDTTGYRAMNYNQPDLAYNAKYWGAAFPGSTAPVYTWIESIVAPLDYNSDGTPYSYENYVEASVFDRSTNSIATRYYFWVRDYSALPTGKTLSPIALGAYLLDPQSSGIAFAATLTTNALALYNSAEYIQSNTSVLHIGYGNKPQGDVMHTVWDLIKSGDPNSFLSGLPNSIRKEPAGIYLKYIDSFCGYDSAGAVVPDPRLPLQLRSGINFRPRQTMFLNRTEALRNFVEYANRVMMRYPITETVISLDFLNRHNAVNGSVLHPAVLAATTSNLIAGYSNGIAGVDAKLTGTGPLPTIDGYSLSTGARVLVKNQNNALENGIYTVTNVSSPWVLTRSYDFNGSGSGTVQNGDAVRVLYGSTQSNTAWAVQTSGTIQFGVSLILFTVANANDIPTISRPIYDVRDYWQTVDWWAEGYSNSTKPVIEVPVYADLERITNRTIITGVNGLFIPLEDGLIARVASNAAGNAETYVYTTVDGWTRIGVENGTIQFLSTLYDSNYGWDATTWSNAAISWDRNAAVETRYIIRWINECLYTEELSNYRNRSLMLMFDYISSEVTDQRNYGQWLTKTSFIDVSHKVRNLSQYKLYQRDNTEFLTGFINEVKPYHVVIKDFIYKYTGEDVYQGNVSDFDLPAQYNSDTGIYETPQLVYSPTYDPNQYTTTATIWTEQQYNQWFQNWGLHYSSGAQRISVATLALTLTAGNNTAMLNTTAGMQDTGIVYIDGETIRYTGINRKTNTLLNLLRGFANTAPASHSIGSAVSVPRDAYTVVDGARGYISTPAITISNPSVYPTPRTAATATATLDGGSLGTVQATNLGSGYGGNPLVTVGGGSISVSFTGSAVNTTNNTITVSAHSLQSGDPVVFSSSANRYGLTINSYYYVGVVDANTIALYLDRNAALTLGTPLQKIGLLDSERVRLSNSGTASATLTVTARISTALAADPLRNMRVVLKFDRVSYRADTSGLETAAERIQRYYVPTVNMPGRVLSQLMSGIEYPHATVTSPQFTDTTTVLDSVLDANSFATTDTLYTMSGGNFPDGYAPEELVAAVVTDNLQITVTSNDLSPTSGSGYVTSFSAASGTISSSLPTNTNAIYTAVPTITNSGSGAGCRVDIRIVVQAGVSAISISGSNQTAYISPAYPDTAANYTGYNVGDTLLIKGSNVGGVDGTNDITITVGSIGGKTWTYTQTVNRFGIPVVYAGPNTNGSVLETEYYNQTWYSKSEGWNAAGGWDVSQSWDSSVSRNVTLTNSDHPAAIFLRTHNQ